MRIMVFDVPAESGGALTILKQYYDRAINDKDNQWLFVISTPYLNETENVKVLRYPWIKKSWFHRLYFDKFKAGKIVKKYNVDEVLSLQNVIIQKCKVKQILYLHQPLPFVEKKYKLTENLKFWVYQNLISRMIYKSIKKADRVIVQTRWMKEACLRNVNTENNKFKVEHPKINIEVKNKYTEEIDKNKLFFYPSSALSYKNHKVIIEAAIELKKQNILDYRVVFTLNGNENKDIKQLYRIAKLNNLPIDFIGKIGIEKVYDYYSKSILIFPSYIETFGLPMLEAKLYECPIIASDCAFSHEILDGYEKACFFDAIDFYALSKKMKSIIENNLVET